MGVVGGSDSSTKVEPGLANTECAELLLRQSRCVRFMMLVTTASVMWYERHTTMSVITVMILKAMSAVTVVVAHLMLVVLEVSMEVPVGRSAVSGIERIAELLVGSSTTIALLLLLRSGGRGRSGDRYHG